MRANKGKDTSPELAIRTALHRSGYRYTVDKRPEIDINRRADIVFRAVKVAVFVNGCFWHGCPKHYVSPKSNKKYWSVKVKNNRARDSETKALLQKRGWRVLVVWEHQSTESAYANVVKALKSRNY
jgi:DNA mismatch endonuclease (patch repair protein)